MYMPALKQIGLVTPFTYMYGEAAVMKAVHIWLIMYLCDLASEYVDDTHVLLHLLIYMGRTTANAVSIVLCSQVVLAFKF